MASSYPPVPLLPLPPTSNSRSSHERSALVRSSRKLSKVLGEVPRLPDDGMPLPPSSSTSSVLDLTDTGASVGPGADSAWSKRRPTHLAPLLTPSSETVDILDSPVPTASPVYPHVPARHGSVLSIAPSIVSNSSSAASGSSSDLPSDVSLRRSKLERLRRKLGDEVPPSAAFPTPPLTAVPRAPRTPTASKKVSHGRARSVARPADDARSIAFSISSDESVHRVTFTTSVHSPLPSKTKHVYHAGALPPVPSIPTHLRSASRSGSGHNNDGDDVGLLRPRVKMTAGSQFGGADFKAARRAKREGTATNGTAEPWELVEMVGFLTH